MHKRICTISAPDPFIYTGYISESWNWKNEKQNIHKLQGDISCQTGHAVSENENDSGNMKLHPSFVIYFGNELS